MVFRDALKRFILENLAPEGQAAVGDNDSLIEQGLLDSMALMQLIQFTEEQTGVRVPDDQVYGGNFQSIAAIEALVERLRARDRK